MTLLREININGYFGASPDKTLCNDVVISLYQENDAQINVNMVDFSTLAKVTNFPTPEDFHLGFYSLADGSEVLSYSYSDSEVTLDDNVISVRLHDTAISGMSGSYQMECSILVGGYKLTLFIGTAIFTETNVQL
jgi:hypothetical protein